MARVGMSAESGRVDRATGGGVTRRRPLSLGRGGLMTEQGDKVFELGLELGSPRYVSPLAIAFPDRD